MRRGRFSTVMAVLLAPLAFSSVACNGDSPSAPGSVLTTLRLSLADSAAEVGQFTHATATALDQHDAPIAAGPATYVSSKPEVAGISPTTGLILAIAPGTTLITATVDGRTAQRVLTVFAAAVRINEIEPDGNALGGWVEFYNPTDAAVDLSGWTLTGPDIFIGSQLPVGTTILARGYLVVDESQILFGLDGDGYEFHVFSRHGVQVDAHAWSAEPATTFGRCPEGTGDFVTTTVPTRGSENACP